VSRGYETRDVDFRRVLAAGFGLAVVVAVFFVLMWVLFSYLLDREATSSAPAHRLAAGQARTEPPGPHLQTDPSGDLAIFQAENQRILSTYGWVDPDAGTVRIPIERAMELALKRGFPVRKGGDLTGAPDPRFEVFVREREQSESASENPPQAARRKRRRGAR
jgi:hypothetical protein